jgi:hypothetical protein
MGAPASGKNQNLATVTYSDQGRQVLAIHDAPAEPSPEKFTDPVYH